MTGYHRNGTPRYGHRWIPDQDYIPRLRQAFQMRLTGATLGAIHQVTHLFGSINCYHVMFNNKIYIGILEYAGLVIENYCEPVIDRATWDGVQKVQASFANRQHVRSNSRAHPRHLNGPFLLSGLVTCLRCTAPLVGQTNTSKGHTYQSYRCTDAKNRHQCDAPMIPAKELEAKVLHILQEYVLKPDILVTMLEEGRAAGQTHRQEVKHEIGLHRRKLRKVDAQIARLTSAIAAAGHSAALLEKLKSTETAHSQLQAELAGLEYEAAQSDQPQLTLDQVTRYCATTREQLQHGHIETRRRVLQVMIKQIAVDRDDHDIHGSMDLFAPIPHTDASEVVSISNAPGGNCLYRHNFSVTIHLYRRNKTGSP